MTSTAAAAAATAPRTTDKIGAVLTIIKKPATGAPSTIAAAKPIAVAAKTLASWKAGSTDTPPAATAITPAPATAAMTTPAPPAASAADTKRAELMKLSVKELKQRCDDLGTPVTGNKETLVTRVLNPEQHKRKQAKPGMGIKKKKASGVKKPKKKSSNLPFHLSAVAGLFYGSDLDDGDSDEDSCYGGYGGYGGGRTYCENCDRKDYCDPHNGLCGDCADSIRPAGGCPCWRMNCEYVEEYDCFECEC